MGFGSYDESEQRHQETNSDEDEEAAVNVHEHEYDGEMTLESGSTDDLLGQLQDIKANNEESDDQE